MKYRLYIVTLFAFVMLSSCVKEIIKDDGVSVSAFPSKEIIKASFYGQITDESGNAIVGAQINLLNAKSGLSLQVSDESGNYRFLDEEIKGNYANIQVLAEGMWDTNKNITVQKNRTSRVDIICQSKDEITKFSSDAGKTIMLGNEVEIEFDGGTIVDQNGETYNGEVDLYARSISIEETNFQKLSMGQNWGIDRSDQAIQVNPIFIVEAELFDPNGNQLQIDENSKAKIRIPVPANFDVSVLELSFMHFNETFFGWDETQSFELINGIVEVEVPHFSIWTWCNIFDIDASIGGRIDAKSNGISIDALHYVMLDYGPITLFTSTATDGYFYMPFAITGKPFELIILNECEEMVHQADYAGYQDSFDFGTILIENDGITYSTLNVEVINCDSTWVENGYATISFDGLNYKRREYIPITNGAFQYSFLDCENNLTGELFLLNEDNLLTTEPIEINLNNGDVNLGEVILCDTFENFMEIIIDGNQFIKNHKLVSGGLGGGMEYEQLTGVLSVDKWANFITTGRWDGPGNYDVRFGILEDDLNNLKYDIEEGQVVFNIIDFEPNEDDPDNHFLRPKTLFGSFSGTAIERDLETNAFIKEVNISGTFEYH